MKMRMLTKMILFILLPACLGFATLTLVSDYLAREGMSRQINEDMKLLVGVQARELNNILNILKFTTQNLAETPVIVGYLAGLARGDDLTTERENADQTLQILVKNYPRIQAAGFIDAKGIMQVHTNKQLVGQNMASRGYFQEAVSQKKTIIFTEYSDIVKKVVCLIVSPVIEKGTVTGLALTDVNIDSLAASTTDLVRVAKTGFCFFYTPGGKIISHPDKSLVGQDQSGLGWVQTVMREKKGMVRYDWKGMSKIAYFENVPVTGWSVVIGVEEADVLSPIRQMSNTTMTLAAVVTLLVGGIIFTIARNMASVLRGAAGLAAYVAAGNFTLTPAYTNQLDRDSRRSDEIGDLSQALRSMINSLSELFASSGQKTREAEEAMAKAEVALRQAEEATRRAEGARREGMLSAAAELEGAVAVISSASTELAAQIEQSERGSVEQAARLTSTATAMEEMNATVLEVAQNASRTSEAALGTRQRAENGAQVVQKAVSAIRTVQEQAQKLKADMNGLDTSAQAINQIMGVISDIADQTNLLALNAAIEAARAGEAGRGFAVVADEVRKLAEKTMASTTDVGKAIRDIQQAASQSIAQVDMSMHAIDDATHFANESGTALQEIVGMVDIAADQVRSIATASEQQSATSEEINNAITQINGIASETARAMQESASAVGDLARQAQVLTKLIDDMKHSS